MSMRLQVVMAETEVREYRRLAKREGLTLAEWVRQKLRRARDDAPSADTDRKLGSIRAAVPYSFPTADIDQMLAEIESGYRS